MFAIGAAQDAQRYTVVMPPSNVCAGSPPGLNLTECEVGSVRNPQRFAIIRQQALCLACAL